MEQEIAERFSKEFRIDIAQVVREFWETVILKELFNSREGRFLIFKGGTALRLVYGSPRFSEDLDFSLTKDALKGKFKPLIKKIVSSYTELSITDMEEKYYTYLGEIKVREGYLTFPFRIKIEISTRQEKGYKSELSLISSPASTIECLGRVSTLEQLYKDKLLCLKDRAKPKDVFDLWYICQKLKKPYAPQDISIPKQAFVRELRKYLPQNFWPVIDSLRQ
ncbi:MAG: nucleotidyl transferase AbiEii/AbiGii toxin family protein [Thermodesulfovibrionales bacterium]|nr:nucleotidyl transferase AbiEii/AbiGii toxin family protein [Thermodesulfovibrionales bacterium]